MRKRLGLALVAAACFLITPALAQEAEPPSARADQAIAGSFRAAATAAQHGPGTVKLRDQATLKLPKGYRFIPKAEAAALLEAMGNSGGDDLLGMVLPEEVGAWMVVARFEEAGYIKDDDAKDWNADELLTSLKEGTEASNEARRERGLGEIEVVGWVEKPTYDAAGHRLVWAASARDKGAPADAGSGINYNTYALGRDGYISLNLVTDLDRIGFDKPVAATLLSGLTFVSGKRYADFNAQTDKVAEYGLAALVAGVAAKKLGLFALIALFAAKFFKVIALAGVAAAAFFGQKLFGRKPEADAPASTTDAPATEEPVSEEQTSVVAQAPAEAPAKEEQAP